MTENLRLICGYIYTDWHFITDYYAYGKQFNETNFRIQRTNFRPKGRKLPKQPNSECTRTKVKFRLDSLSCQFNTAV